MIEENAGSAEPAYGRTSVKNQLESIIIEVEGI